MKPILFGYSDSIGGASIATYRIHRSLLSQGIESRMWVQKKLTDDWTVQTSKKALERISSQLRPLIGDSLPNLLVRDCKSIQRSYNWIPSNWSKRLNDSDSDIIHLNWYNNEVLSISEVSRIEKPVVQTLHDMWSFCGAEHYSEDVRWKNNYRKDTRDDDQHGFDIDRYTFLRKKKNWTRPWHLVAISQWMAECISSSSLFQDWPVTVIPNPVDTNVWKPIDQKLCREALNLPADKPLLSFGAIGGTRNPRKGYHLMIEALHHLKKCGKSDIHVVIFGESQPRESMECPFPVTYMGKLHDPLSMVLLNNAVDVLVNPAIQEAFGQTGSEAHACGLPVVAFDGTGLTDIIEHKETGYLAKPGDSEDLAHGVQWVLENNTITDNLEESKIKPLDLKARKKACEQFSYEVVGARYNDLYDQTINDFKSRKNR